MGYEWEKAFREKPHFEVVVKEWDIALKDATPEEFEDLGVMICVALNGPERCESFAKGILPGVMSGKEDACLFVSSCLLTNQSRT